MHEASQFEKHVAMRLCAAFRSSYVAKSFTEVLADLHEDGYDSASEREVWENLASLIVARREEVSEFFERAEARMIQ